jgi:predicted regulator of Ras-like GTPase activity (Roadblock/LC7/MglB family)
MESIPILAVEDVAQIDAALGEYLDKSEADLALVLDRGGNIISQQGESSAPHLSIVAALAAGSFAATKELASRIGEPEFSALYHQGKGTHVFMNGVDENTILLTVFSEKTTVGLIRFYSANCARKLKQILDRLRSEPRRDRFTLTVSDIQKAGRVFGR